MNKKLQKIQNELKAPKTNMNTFGGYKYRNVEDIMKGVKPLLDKYGCTLTLTDEVVLVGDRFYIKSMATITDTDTGASVSTLGWAREDESKKGMDVSQLTGSCSSYARKYALNGLLCIDDSKDIDSMDNTAPRRRRRVSDEKSDCPF